MKSKQIPAEYAWIKPGAVGSHPLFHIPITFTSSPWIDVDNTKLWCADTKEFGPVNVRYFVQVEPQVEPPKDTAEQTLAKARAVLAEHRDGVVMGREVYEEMMQGKYEICPTLKALVALADALEGGGDE